MSLLQSIYSLQCFDAVGWAAERHPAWKTEWCGAVMVVCLGRGADLHMAQLMPLPLTISCSSKSILVLPFWYQLIQVVPDTHTHTQPFYCWSGICPGPPGSAGTRKVKPRRLKQSGFTGARDSEWQWHLLGYMQVCTPCRQPRQHPTTALRTNGR